MADVTSTFASLSSTESSNAPTGATAVGTGLDDNLRMIEAHQAAARDASGWFGLTLSSVSGTNTVVGSVAAQGSITMAPTAYATGMRFTFTPAATNTGAVTLNVNSLGAKNVFFGGRACIGGEIKISQPVEVQYDGTQFQIIGSLDINTLTADTSPDGANDFVETYDASATGPKKVSINNLILGSGGTAGTSMVLLTTKAASVSASVTITSSDIDFTAYDEYEFRLSGIQPASDAQILQLNVSTNGGASYDTGAGTYGDAGNIQNDAAAAGSFGASRTYISLTGELGAGNAATRSINGIVKMFLPNSSTLHKFFDWKMGLVRTTGELNSVLGHGRYNSATAINGVRFQFGSGNITTGKIRVFGIKNS